MSQSDFIKTDIDGCWVYRSSVFRDNRGVFSKTFNSDIFNQIGIQMSIREVFYSYSQKNVIRGMHFQSPPHDHMKIITCLSGHVLDVILDLRKSSKTYGISVGINLNGLDGGVVIIPRGCAHGFYSYENDSLMAYLVETVHNKDSDQGILWNSFGYQWPTLNPIISNRDQQFQAMQDFSSPF